PSFLHDQVADRALLPMAEGVVDERELPRDIAGELEAHSTTRGHGEGLYPMDRPPGRGTDVHRVELLPDDVERTRMGRPGIHHPEADPLSHSHTDRLTAVLIGSTIERDEV